MSVFTDDKKGVKDPFVEGLNLGKGIKADLNFISHAVHFNLNPCRGFMNKITFQVSYHGGENSSFLRYLCPQFEEIICYE